MPQKAAYRPTPTNPTTPAEPLPASSATEDLDAFLDEVDDLLEDNALGVVRAYIQKPGE